jgi:hypothetical protein
MPTKAREYVSVSGMGDLVKIQSMVADITKLVREQFRSQDDERRGTFGGCIIRSEKDLEEEALSYPEIRQFSGGTFPVLWLNFTFDPEKVSSEEVQAFEETFSLRLLGEVESAKPFR